MCIRDSNIDASDSLLSHETKSIIIDYGDSVIKHLFRMTSGLESMIVGEDQILGQVSDAKQKAFKAVSYTHLDVYKRQY